jgi:LmbE family N-acetylglucosaminyl deacetylase
MLDVVAHDYDEVLGCGDHDCSPCRGGDQVQMLIVAERATSRQVQRDRLQAGDELSALARAAQTAGSILALVDVELLDLPVNRLD